MSLIAHHIVTSLVSLGMNSYKIHRLPGIPNEEFLLLANLIAGAEKIDFGPVPMERVEASPDNGLDPIFGQSAYRLPTLTDDERQFWRERLIPLPAPVTWVEYQTASARCGKLIQETPTGWKITRIDLDLKKQTLAYTGITSVTEFATSMHDGQTHLQAEGCTKVLKVLEGNKNLQIMSATNLHMAVYLMLMLNSKSTERIMSEDPPAKLNAKRARTGKAPLYKHLIVRIVPKSIRPAAGLGGTHASPRLHWMRSHKRHYDRAVPSAKWVAHEVHNDVTGWWVTIVPRCLRGKAELGTVTHHYQMSAPEKNDDDDKNL